MTTLDWIVLGLFFLALVGIIIWVLRQKEENTKDYFLAGKDVGWIAIGASIFASELTDSIIRDDSWVDSSKVVFETHEPLRKAEHLLDYRVNHHSKLEIKAGEKYILGVDAGSTTTKAVLFNISRNSVGASAYLRTLGNPILATKQCIDKLMSQVGDNSIKIAALTAAPK